LTAVLVALGVLALVLTTAGSDSVSIANRQADDTARTLAQVKEALIGWSASRTPPTDGADARPGELPCPDINPLDGYEDGSCVAGALGRVPWKTLKIPEPKDEAGETLWYTIAGPFRKVVNSPAPITSDTLGNITVYQGSTATTLTTQAVAVIFAPGAAVGTQDRSTTDTMDCTAPSGTYERNLCASNYLETAGTTNNATINGPFIQAQASSAFNDRLLVITNADLMPAVEPRVAREMISILQRYKTATGVYPWADRFEGNSDGSFPDYFNRARFPCGNALPTSWAGAGITLPNWLQNGCTNPVTGWTSVIYYTVAKNRLQNGGINCTTCTDATLTVTNASNRIADLCLTTGVTCVAPTWWSSPTVVSSGAAAADLILITPGAATGNPPRNWPTDWSAITGYFEDTENSENVTGVNSDKYVVPSSTNNNRDRIYIVR